MLVQVLLWPVLVDLENSSYSVTVALLRRVVVLVVVQAWEEAY